MLSSNFINKVINKIDSMNLENLREFIYHLRDDREFFKTIFFSMLEGVIVLDTEMNIQYINNSARNILEIKDSNVIGQRFKQFIKNDELREYILNSIRKKNRVNDRELNLGYPTIKCLRINIIPLLKEETIIGDILMFQDITDEKIEKIKLRRAESLAALTTLAAGVAHEIKNPLGSIGIHIQLIERILKKLDNKNAEQIHSLLEIINEEIERLNDIVKNFLFTVRPVELTTENINLYNLLSDIVNFIKYEAEKEGIDIIFEVPKNLPKIFADSRYLRPAFLNIIKNAIEACTQGDKVEISGCEKDETVEIQISDSGHGISKEDVDKIFEPYFSTKDTGTGLGLTIVYKIIREHGGNLKVDSVDNKGTTFTIILPTNKKPKTKGIEFSG